MNEEKYLPLGTVVMLKNGKKKLMITGFTAMTNDDNKIYDYTGCLYPEGFLGPDKMALFDHEDIEKIYFKGYSDSDDKGFKELLKSVGNDFSEYNNNLENN